MTDKVVNWRTLFLDHTGHVGLEMGVSGKLWEIPEISSFKLRIDISRNQQAGLNNCSVRAGLKANRPLWLVKNKISRIMF